MRRADRSVALLADDELGAPGDGIPIFVRRVRPFVDLGAVDEHHEVGVLLDRARLAQVGELRALVLRRALFRRARELRERHHRYIELLRERLERTRDETDLLLPALGVERPR